ncbi:hypothetical protein D9M71_237430 [compost metagenome]
MAFEHVTPAQNLGHRDQQLFQANIGQQFARLGLGRVQLGYVEVTTDPAEAIDAFCRSLEALVLLQATDEFGARVVLLRLDLGRTRQQHARLDLGEHRGHHQVFGGQLQANAFHQLDVPHVLTGDFRHRDVEDIDVLLADQVQQQVQRPFKRFQEYLQRVRRDVQVQRHFGERLTVHKRERKLLLRIGLGIHGLAVFSNLRAHASTRNGVGSPQPTRMTSGSSSARLITVDASTPPKPPSMIRST